MPAATTPFADHYFAVTDKMDSKAFALMFHEDASFTFANNPPAVGRAAIAAQAQWVFDLINKIQHQQRGAWAVGNTHVMEGRCVYFRKDGKVIEIPFCSVGEVRDGLLTAYRAYVDGAPLLAK
jgi:ketosteroid isomerase-like protein